MRMSYQTFQALKPGDEVVHVHIPKRERGSRAFTPSTETRAVVVRRTDQRVVVRDMDNPQGTETQIQYNGARDWLETLTPERRARWARENLTDLARLAVGQLIVSDYTKGSNHDLRMLIAVIDRIRGTAAAGVLGLEDIEREEMSRLINKYAYASEEEP